MKPKFDIKVKLTGKDGNAFFILGTVVSKLRKAGATPEQIKEFLDEAKSGDYNHLLRTCVEWVNVR